MGAYAYEIEGFYAQYHNTNQPTRGRGNDDQHDSNNEHGIEAKQRRSGGTQYETECGDDCMARIDIMKIIMKILTPKT